MRRPALVAVAILTAVPAFACGDFLSSNNNDDPLFLEGSFQAQEMIPSGSGGDLIAEGWQVGIAFVPNLGAYLVVRLPPESTFIGPDISFGGFSTEGEQRVLYSDEQGEPRETGEISVEGAQGSEIFQFDFEEGSFGFLQMRTTAAGFGDLSAVRGTYEATEFVLTDADGESMDLLADPDAEILINLDPRSNWPAWGGYQMTLDAPAGVLADTAVSITYPDPSVAQQEAFIGVGESMAFFDLLGCEVFAAGDVLLTGPVTFRGYACDVAGESYMVDASFEAS